MREPRGASAVSRAIFGDVAAPEDVPVPTDAEHERFRG